jgi:hypothetical protein
MMRKAHFLILSLGMVFFSSIFSYAQVTLITLPYEEHFDTTAFPAGWTQQHEMGVTTNIWSVSNTAEAGGLPCEMKADWVNQTGYTRLVLPPVNTTNVPGILLSFKHMIFDYYFGLVFKIQSSSDGINWDDENWFRFSGWGNIGPEQAYTTVLDNLGDTTWIAFEIEGDHYEFWAWHLDDVMLSVMSTPPDCTPLLLPAAGDTFVSINQKFTWLPTPGAADYYFFLGTDNPPSNWINGAFSNGMEEYLVYNLISGTQYYWRIVPFNVFGSAQHCDIQTFTTMIPYELPFEEHFDSTNMPFAWMEQDSAVNPGWYIFQGNYVGEAPNELEIDFQVGNGISRIISPPITTDGIQSLTLRFNHGYGDDGPGLTLKVQSSSDANHWTDEGFHFHSDSVQYFTGVPVETTLTHNLGSTFYFSFTVEGNLNAFNYWAIDDVELTETVAETGSLSGLIVYDNNAQSALQDVTVYLLDSTNTVIDSTLTDINGNFLFTALQPGTYHLQSQTDLPWGGGNAVDGLLIMKHFVGMIQLQGIRALAADIDGNNFVNAVDGLLVMKRFVGMISYFAVGNWIFESPNVNVSAGQNTSTVIKGLCYGDVDGSRTIAP